MPRMKGFYKILQQAPRYHDSGNLKSFFFILDFRDLRETGIFQHCSNLIFGSPANGIDAITMNTTHLLSTAII